MEQRVSVITLGVADLERSRRFYEEGLHWTAAWTDGDVAFYQAGGLVFALWTASSLAADAGIPLPGAATPGARALGHNVRTREEVAALMADAEHAGADILKPTGDTFWGGVTGYFADPDGHIWEVAWNPGWPIADDGSVHFPG